MKCESKGKNSLFSELFLGNTGKYIGIVLLLFIAIPATSKAQMFSAGSEEPRFNTPQHGIYGGLELMDVNYQGSQGNSQGSFEFEGPLIRVGYDSPTLDLYLGTGGQITGIENVSYFDVGGNLSPAIQLYHSKTIRLEIPVRISARFTNMTNSESITINSNRFRFGSLTAGAGGRILVRPAEDFRIKAGAVPSYGFAFASGGLFGGGLGSVVAHGRLYLDHLFGDMGLSIGYKYNLRNYDIDENTYDYKMTGHIIEAGITF